MKLPEFHWKLDPVAVAALILSAAAALSQFWFWWSGSSVRLIPPDRVGLYSQVAPDGSIIVRVAADMSYANVAQGPYGDLVLKERAELRIGNVTSRQQWNAFGTISTREGIRMKDLASPQPLPGQSAVSHFTLFAPATQLCPAGSTTCNPKQDYLSPSNLAAQLNKADRIQLKFEIELIDGDRETASCYVPLSDQTKKQLANIQASYAYLRCHPDRPQ